MIWKILVELGLVVVMLILATSFWALKKSPAHLRALLADPVELCRICDLIGREKLIQEAAVVEPVYGSYASNIETWDEAHERSLRHTARAVGIAIIVIMIASWFLGFAYFLAVLVTFAIPAIWEIPASAKNNNATHVHTIIVNLIRWSEVDDPSCSEYCVGKRPEFAYLYVAIRQTW
jgi:hypothetical protein